MYLQFLGTGSAFTLKNYQTSAILNHKGKNLLIDCGGDTRFSANECGYSFSDIDAVYISHLHGDHMGGLEWLGFTTYFTPGCKRPKLYIEQSLISDLWSALRVGMESLQGKIATLKTYFDVIPIEVNIPFVWNEISFDTIQTQHIVSKYKFVPSFGLMWDTLCGDRVYFTTDCQYAPETAQMAYYEEATFIFHDCETLYKSGVHAHYDQLKQLPDHIKIKMYLTHYQDNIVLDYENRSLEAVEDGFMGFVRKGTKIPFDL
jgi:ribonuclease BN (tRNA processing enzyme)